MSHACGAAADAAARHPAVSRDQTRASARCRTGSPPVLGFLLALLATRASAGPPLIADDPHAAAAGTLELIVAGQGLGKQSSSDWAAPELDLALGVMEGLELDLVIASLYLARPGTPLDVDAGLSVGAKWQLVRREHVNLSFAPAADVLFADTGASSALVFPLAAEYTRARWAVGTFASWAVVLDGPDAWVFSAYGTGTPTGPLTLMGELWVGRTGFNLPHASGYQTDFGLTAGLDWTTPLGLHLLASGTAVLASTGVEHFGWRAYLGLQWIIPLWKPPSGAKAAVLPWIGGPDAMQTDSAR